MLETIGNVYVGLGLTTQAETMLQRALDLRRAQQPGPRLETASILQNLALVYLVQLRYEEAEESAREELSMRRTLLGDDHKDTATAKAVLGMVLLTALKNLDETEQLLRDSISWRQQHLSPDDPEAAMSMLGLASVYGLKNELQKAMPLYVQATGALLKNPETKSFGLAIAEDQQARLMWRLKQPQAAVEKSTLAIKHFRDFAADDHPVFSLLANSHAQSLRLAGKNDEAAQFFRDWVQRMRDGHSPGTAMAIRGMAEHFISSDTESLVDEAQAVCRAWLSEMEQAGRAPGAFDYSIQAYLAASLAIKAERTGDAPSIDAARRAWRKIIDSSNAVRARRPHSREAFNVSVAHAFSVATRRLAFAMQNAGDQAAAIALYRDASAFMVNLKVYGRAIPYLTTAADLAVDEGDASEAERLYHKAFELCDRASFADEVVRSGWRDSTRFRYASLLVDHQRKREAEDIYRKIMADSKNLNFGAFNSLSGLLIERGAVDEAMELLRSSATRNSGVYSVWIEAWSSIYQRERSAGALKDALIGLIERAKPAMAAARQQLGANHEEVAAFLVNLGRALMEQQECQTAEPMLREGLEIRRQTLPSSDWRQGSAESVLGECLAQLERYEEAEALLLSGYSKLRTSEARPERIAEARDRLARFYDAREQPEKAAEYRQAASPK